MNLSKAAFFVTATVFTLTASGAGAATLTVEPWDAFQSFPPNLSITQVNIGDSGSQAVSTPLTISPSGVVSANEYDFTPSAAAYFNYSLAYAPTSSGIAMTSVGNNQDIPFLFETVAFSQQNATPADPVNVSGSFYMTPGVTYDFVAALFSNVAGNTVPDGSYTLSWNVATTATDTGPLDVAGGTPYVAPVPLPATGLLFGSMIFGMGAIFSRPGKRAVFQ